MNNSLIVTEKFSYAFVKMGIEDLYTSFYEFLSKKFTAEVLRF